MVIERIKIKLKHMNHEKLIERTVQLMEDAEILHKQPYDKKRYVLASLNFAIDKIKDEYIRNTFYKFNQNVTPKIIEFLILASKGKLKINKKSVKCFSDCCSENNFQSCCEII